MDYGMIGKIEKAKIYAEEREERFQFEALRVRVKGENNSHIVNYENGTWNCDCDFFTRRHVCSHTMALERVLANMIEIGSTN